MVTLDGCPSFQRAVVTAEGGTIRGISRGEAQPDTPIPTLCSETHTSAFNYFFLLYLCLPSSTTIYLSLLSKLYLSVLKSMLIIIMCVPNQSKLTKSQTPIISATSTH